MMTPPEAGKQAGRQAGTHLPVRYTVTGTVLHSKRADDDGQTGPLYLFGERREVLDCFFRSSSPLLALRRLPSGSVSVDGNGAKTNNSPQRPEPIAT